MVQSLRWNSDTNLLGAIADGKFTVWYYPNAVYVDKDLLSKTVAHREARYVNSWVCMLLKPDEQMWPTRRFVFFYHDISQLY